MKKTILCLFVLALVLSLSSCAFFQGEMNVAGSWSFSWQSSSPERTDLELLEMRNNESRATATASVDIVQNGSALSGTWHGQKDFSLTGTVNKSGSIKMSMAIDGVEVEIDGTVAGENSIFKKEGTTMSGTMRFKHLAQTLSYPFTASRK